MPTNQKYTSWDRKGPIAKELVKQFTLFQSTNGAAGIDPSLDKPVTIKEVFWKHQFLQPLNPSYFPDHFRTLSQQWRFVKDNSRKGGKKVEWKK